LGDADDGGAQYADEAAKDGFVTASHSIPFVEQTGTTSGYGYIARTGRIAGDVWGGGGSDAYQMQHYRNLDNTMRAYPEIVARWQASGVTPDRRVAFYCGTGWRASEAWYCALLMGWQHIAVYDGGWLEWAQDPTNPIEVGGESKSSQDADGQPA
jgi:thiosulfate/3-mercaptopyruvate sulfurtransferase